MRDMRYCLFGRESFGTSQLRCRPPAQGATMSRTFISRILVVSVTLVSLLMLARPAAPQERVPGGTLECDISGGIGLVLGSQRTVSCTFTPNTPGRPLEFYTGTISNYGVDIGVTSAGLMEWAVFFLPNARPVGALAGIYAGPTAQASLYVGAGANLLVGGSEGTVALQPLSVEGQLGVNIAAGVAGLELRFMR
jgi:hypothetical protein